MKQLGFILLISFLTLNFACKSELVADKPIEEIKSAPRVAAPENLIEAMRAVAPFFKLMSEPSADEWLATHGERGQTFEQYINGKPSVPPAADGRTIYIQPLGKFDDKQLRVVRLAAEFMKQFYGLPVRMLARREFEKSLAVKNYRTDKFTGKRQIRTGYILEEILQPALPPDAAALIAFTNEDLFPGANYNYVFGQASLENRVGVWSLARLGGAVDFEKFFTRTLKVAVHETGHMFSFAHCTKYECVMSGANHLGETDKHPLDACPECMAKICWMSGYDAKKRYENLAEFCNRNNLRKDAEEFRKKALAVGKN